MIDIDYSNIVDFIVKTVQEDSSSFQYIVDSSYVEGVFEIELDSLAVNQIIEGLLQREEVADVEFYESGFDIVLYTDYAPNYEGDYEL